MASLPLVTQPGVIGRGQNHPGNPNSIFRPGGTSVWLLEYTVAGAGRIRMAGGAVRAEPGDFFLYKPLTLQDYSMDPDAGRWDHVWFTFSPRPHWHDWLQWPELPGGPQFLRIPEPDVRQQLLARMEHARRIFAGTHARRRDFVMNVLEEVLLVCDGWNPNSRAATLDDRIRHALQHLCEHAAEKFTLQKLAQVCGLSPSRLSHLFKEQVGETPLQYLEQRRIETARDLLLMTGKPVAQVAYEVGFSNPFYFSRIYRRRMGHPPSAARPKRSGGR
jgi:AraC family transcriptional regulator of arabinose operon